MATAYLTNEQIIALCNYIFIKIDKLKRQQTCCFRCYPQKYYENTSFGKTINDRLSFPQKLNLTFP